MEVVQVYLRARAIWEVPTCSSGRRGRGVRANLAGGSGAYWISWAVEVPSCDFCCSLTTPISGPRRACGPAGYMISICWPWEMGCASLAAVAGRWASGTESIGALQLKPAQPQLLASRCSAAGGRLGAGSSSSIKRAPAANASQRPPACITTNQQPLGRAKSADGPASAASHRSNMAFLSTRTSTPPGRGPVNKKNAAINRRSYK